MIVPLQLFIFLSFLMNLVLTRLVRRYKIQPGGQRITRAVRLSKAESENKENTANERPTTILSSKKKKKKKTPRFYRQVKQLYLYNITIGTHKYLVLWGRTGGERSS
jgi:hypothetical protein